MSHSASSNVRPPPDPALVEIADYVSHFNTDAPEALETARYCLMDSLGCAILALRYPECTRLLGPTFSGMTVPYGARVPGTQFVLDPINAAFNIGTLIRWLDYNDTWLAAEWGHPSDNLGAILALADYQCRKNGSLGLDRMTVGDLLQHMIRAHEIQGVLALENSFNRVGLDHVILVRIASTAVATHMLGGTRQQVIHALTNAWIDGGALRTYRHAPNTGTRKSWAAGDATSRGVRLAFMALQGEMGYPSALSAPRWGFSDVLMKQQPIRIARALGSYVMENVLFKISFPAEFHAQTAVEAALQLHPSVSPRLEEIERVVIETQESAVRIIDKHGPLHNPADRDHCLQYMVAVGLIFGELTADHYQDAWASDPRIDPLREKMVVSEKPEYSSDYLDPDKRSIANALQVFFRDGSSSPRVEVEYPVGHRRRRREGFPLLREKFRENLLTHFAPEQVARMEALFAEPARLDAMPVDAFLDLWVEI